MATQSPLVVIVGETAGGKSLLAMELALKYNGEIISADSWAVRKELNIGTAKPSAADLKKVPHHLIDIVEPCQDFTAAIYKRLAINAISDISARGKLPIIVGGTGLYIDGIIFDFSFLKSGSATERNRLNALSIDQLLKQITDLKIDHKGIDTRNKRRLIRLIETGGLRPTRKKLRQNTLIIGLKIDKEILKENITRRVNSMFENGLEDEAKNLASKYGWNCEGLKGIGYKEWQPYFDGSQTLEDTKTSIIKATLDLAKRQRTYFKRNPFIQWVENVNGAFGIAENFLNKKF